MSDDSFIAAVLAVSVVTFLLLLAGYGIVRWVLGGSDAAFEEVGR